MKRAIAMTAATLMGATMLAAPALAQMDTIEPQVEMNTGTGVDGGVEAETLPGGIDQGTTAAIDGEASFDDALAAISGNAGSTASLGMVSEVNEVEIIRLSELDGYDEEMLDQSLEASAGSDVELRSALEANSALAGELEDENVDIEAVVAAEVENDGRIKIYVR
jgi:hypothetical protein